MANDYTQYVMSNQINFLSVGKRDNTYYEIRNSADRVIAVIVKAIVGEDAQDKGRWIINWQHADDEHFSSPVPLEISEKQFKSAYKAINFYFKTVLQ